MTAVTPHSVVFNFDIRESLSPWGSPVFKGKRTQSVEYLNWHAEHNPYCIVCGKPGQRDHSVPGRGNNSRASDFLVFANCAEHHIGRSKIIIYEQTWGVNVANDIERNLIRYALHLGVSGRFSSLRDFEIAVINASKKHRKVA